MSDYDCSQRGCPNLAYEDGLCWHCYNEVRDRAAWEVVEAAEFLLEHYRTHGHLVGHLAIDRLESAVKKARGKP